MSHQYRERRRARKLRFVENEYIDRGCSFCGYRGHEAALKTIAPRGGRSPIRLAHDDASYDRIKRALKAQQVTCLNCEAVRKREALKERYGG